VVCDLGFLWKLELGIWSFPKVNIANKTVADQQADLATSIGYVSSLRSYRAREFVSENVVDARNSASLLELNQN